MVRVQVNNTAMPRQPGAEQTIHHHIAAVKQRDKPIVIDFELPNGKHETLTFESYVTRADLKKALK